jgi:hypothetical protein
MSTEGIGDFPPIKEGYILRAVVAMIGLGANLPEIAVYPNSSVDFPKGNPYNSANNYVLHSVLVSIDVCSRWLSGTQQLPGTQQPPYRRYKLGNKDPAPGMQYNDDSSLDICIQADDHLGDKTSNWLPTPTDGGANFWPDQCVAGRVAYAWRLASRVIAMYLRKLRLRGTLIMKLV